MSRSMRPAGVLGLAVLLGLLHPLPTYAQFLPRHDGARMKAMPYRNSSGERGVTFFHYGRDGVMRSELWMLEDHARCSANYYVYDDSGRVTEKYREFSDSLTSTQRYAYDAAGRCIQERFSRSDGREGKADFEWGENGRLVAADCRRFRGWFNGKASYRHEGDRLAGATISRDGDEIGAIEYVYGAEGRLTSETWRFGEQWSQTFDYEYEPVPRVVWSAASPLQMMNLRFRVASESYDFNGQGGGPSNYRYDPDGRLAEKTFERADGLKTVTTYAFDGQGSLISSHREYSTGLAADFEYRYDDALRLVEKTFRRSDGAEGFERYRYDRLGRLVGAEYGNMDFWLTGTIAFTYDKWGRLAAGRYEGADGRDADLELGCDAHGNVLKIRWAFDDGPTQTYRFTYVPAETDILP